MPAAPLCKYRWLVHSMSTCQGWVHLCLHVGDEGVQLFQLLHYIKINRWGVEEGGVQLLQYLRLSCFSAPCLLSFAI